MKVEFYLRCKKLYFQGITPLDKLKSENEDYKQIVLIAKEYFERNLYKEYVGGFQEGQYFIELWIAHLLLEFGNPESDIRNYALEVIRKYAESDFNLKVSEEEKLWLIEQNLNDN